MQPPIDGKEERLDAVITKLDQILAELRATRERIEAGNPQPQEVIELREPMKARARR